MRSHPLSKVVSGEIIKQKRKKSKIIYVKIQKTDKQEERNFYMQCSEQRLKAITGKSEV